MPRAESISDGSFRLQGSVLQELKCRFRFLHSAKCRLYLKNDCLNRSSIALCEAAHEIFWPPFLYESNPGVVHGRIRWQFWNPILPGWSMEPQKVGVLESFAFQMSPPFLRIFPSHSAKTECIEKRQIALESHWTALYYACKLFFPFLTIWVQIQWHCSSMLPRKYFPRISQSHFPVNVPRYVENSGRYYAHFSISKYCEVSCIAQPPSYIAPPPQFGCKKSYSIIFFIVQIVATAFCEWNYRSLLSMSPPHR